MKNLSVEQMEQINGGQTTAGCAAAFAAGIGLIFISGMTAGAAGILAPLFLSGAAAGLYNCY